jgi:putative transposase
MSLRNQSLLPDEYYHIYNRGNGKNKIFLEEEDYNRFTKILYICNSENKFVFRESITKKRIDVWDFKKTNPLVDIVSWVLMPNHFHILLISDSHRQDLWLEGLNPISMYMQKVSTAYAMYFNKKYNRTGSLFEGKFKSKHVRQENHLQYLFAYIHLNPIKLIQPDWKENGVQDKKRALSYLKEYRYSSFQDYLHSNRKEAAICNFEHPFQDFKYRHIEDIFTWINAQP